MPLSDRAGNHFKTGSTEYDAGVTALQMEDYSHAEELFRHVLKTEKTPTPALFILLAQSLDGLERKGEARQLLHDAVQRFPKSKRIHAALGDLHRSAGDFHKAADCYTAAIAAETDDFSSPRTIDYLHDNHAVCLDATGELRQAERIFRELVCRYPGNQRYAEHLHHNLMKQKRAREADLFRSEFMPWAAETASIEKTDTDLSRQEDVFREQVCRSPHDFSHARDLYVNLTQQNKRDEAEAFKKEFMPFWLLPHTDKSLLLDCLKHVNLYSRKLVIYGINPELGFDRMAREVSQWLHKKGLDVCYFVDDEATVEEFEGKPVHCIFDLLLEDMDSILLLSLHNPNMANPSVQALAVSMLGVRADGFLDCSPQKDIGSAYQFDKIFGNSFRENPVLDINMPGFMTFGDMHNKNALKIVTLGGSTSDPVFSKLTLRGIKPWSELLQEFLAGNDIPAIVHCGAVSGFKSHHELLKIIRDVVLLEPDIVISYSGVNEILESDFPFDAYYYTKFLEELKGVMSGIGKTLSWNFPVDSTNGLRTDKDASRQYIDNIRMMRAVSKEFSFDFVPVLQALPGLGDACEYDNLRRMTRSTKDNTHYWHYCSRLIREDFMKLKESIAQHPYILDYTGIFTGKGRDLYFDFCHVTTRGNRIIAQKMYEDLSKMNLLKGKKR